MLRHSFITASLLLVVPFALAQTCYYPDKVTVSTDTPCNSNANSACCPSDSFCMTNGLCFGGGLLSRGSCTDQTWGSSACASDCVSSTSNLSTSEPLMPCSTNTFACGLDSTTCQNSSNTFTLSGSESFVLRPAQVAALIQGETSNTSSAAATSCASHTSAAGATNELGERMYPGSAMLGVSLGLGFALAIALVSCWILYGRVQVHSRMRPRTLYEADDQRSPTTPQHTIMPKESSQSLGRPSTVFTMHSEHTAIAPTTPRSFLDRYAHKFKNPEVQEMETNIPRYELGSDPAYSEQQRSDVPHSVAQQQHTLGWMIQNAQR